MLPGGGESRAPYADRDHGVPILGTSRQVVERIALFQSFTSELVDGFGERS